MDFVLPAHSILKRLRSIAGISPLLDILEYHWVTAICSQRPPGYTYRFGISIVDRLLEKATRQHTKDHNSQLVLRTIYDSNEISRAELARLTRLTRTTISEVVAHLIERGLVEEIGHGR